MRKCSLLLAILIALCEVVTRSNGLEKDWTYTLQQIICTSINPEIIEHTLRAVRVSPGVYGVSGSLDIKVDIYDEFTAEARLYKSASGSSQYTATPFQFAKGPFSKFMNAGYKNFLMNDLKGCSDLPQFTDEWKPPLKAHKYVWNSCVFSTENFPTHMQPGFYKILFKATKEEFQLTLEIIVKIDAKPVLG